MIRAASRARRQPAVRSASMHLMPVRIRLLQQRVAGRGGGIAEQDVEAPVARPLNDCPLRQPSATSNAAMSPLGAPNG